MFVYHIKDRSDYTSIKAKLKRAFEFIESNDLSNEEPGRIEIDGDEIFANIQHYNTGNEDLINYESHDRYIDVQYMIEGSEKIKVIGRDKIGPVNIPYNSENDITFYNDPQKQGTELHMEKGEVAVFFPQDCHKTQCSLVENKPVNNKKVIVKVKI